MKKFFCCFLFAYCLIPNIALGQLPAKGMTLAKSLRPFISSLRNTSVNFDQMALSGEFSPRTLYLTLAVGGSIREVAALVDHVSDLAGIFATTTNVEDRRNVQQYLELRIESAKEQSKLTLSFINETMPKISNAAGLSEMSRARDSIHQLQLVLNSW